MRVGILGTGFMGRIHAAGWAETPAQLVGFVSKDPEEAAQLALDTGKPVFDSVEELLDEVDVVDICTPTFLHREMVLQAAAAGKHIICEKPLSFTVGEGKEMIAACKAAGVRLLVAQVVRFFPEYASAKAKVESGALGKPAVVRLSRTSFQPRKSVDNWYLDVNRSGGMLMDLMIHDFDYARWVAGDVTTVYARSVKHDFNAPVDHALVILTHASGAISHVEGSWAFPFPNFLTSFEIACERGLITHDSTRSAPIDLRLHSTGGEGEAAVAVPSSPLLESPYTTELKAFYRAIKHNEPDPVSALDGLAGVQIARAAIESVRTGEPVTLEPLAEVLR